MDRGIAGSGRVKMMVTAYFQIHFEAGGNPDEEFIEVDHGDELKSYINQFLTEYPVSRLDVQIKPIRVKGITKK